jgi:hypothetical protein
MALADSYHEFDEDINDCSMCRCGIPALYHDDWERRMLEPRLDVSEDEMTTTTCRWCGYVLYRTDAGVWRHSATGEIRCSCEAEPARRS